MRLVKVSKRLLLVVLFSLFFCTTMLYLRNHDQISEDDVSIKSVVKWSTKKTLDDNQNVKKGNDRIFFHETSGETEFSLRQTCSIESAAHHNRHRPVQIFIQPQQEYQSTLNSSSTWLRVLQQYSNIQVIVIDDLGLYFRDSPLEQWYFKGDWHKSPFRVEHMSDYIRIVSLYKEGGMFLDLDIVTMKPYDGYLFRNFTLIESSLNDQITNAVMHLDRDHRLISEIIDLMAQEYDPDEYTFHGPQVMSLALSRSCNMTFSHRSSCPDVRMLPHSYFYPIGNAFWSQYFEQEEEAKIILEQFRSCHGFHAWNNLSKNRTIDVSDNSTQVYAVLASENCPVTWNLRRQFSRN